MSEAKHTAGTWVVDHEEGWIVAEKRNEHGLPVLIVDLNWFDANPREVEIANLIAAAPDLLDALKMAVKWIEWHRKNPNVINHNSYLFDSVANAAIAKAKGDPQ